MYLIGSADAHKTDAQRLVAKLAGVRRRLLTDAEVMQEILTGTLPSIVASSSSRHSNLLLPITDEIFSIDRTVAGRAKEIVLAYQRISPRDAIGLAAMQTQGISQILSFDTGLDQFPGIERIF